MSVSTAEAAQAATTLPRNIHRVAVLGSGVMGSRIACHFANIGCQVLLLDIVPQSLTEAEKQKGLSEDSPAFRNRIVNEALQKATKSSPSPLYRKAMAQHIQTGNFSDDMHRIADCEWVLEAVVENLEIKQQLYQQVEEYRRPGTLITSNTSGIPIQWMSQGRSEDFRAHFCGTHFFNPPRYLELLEIIPGPDTRPKVLDFLSDYGNQFLGKTTVRCKDTPAFIGNRIGVFAIMDTLHLMEELGLSIEEIDALTGTLVGRPKSATFRTADVVGIDTFVKVAENLEKGLPHDEMRQRFQVPAFIRKMLENGWLGEKSGQGFYKKSRDEQGKRQILTLDRESLDYRQGQKVKFGTVEAAKPLEKLQERLPMLLVGQDASTTFFQKMFGGLFAYAANRIPEISDELYKLDDAIRAGFGWERGPFEMWDMLGIDKGIELLKARGAELPEWLANMRNNGFETFYRKQDGRQQYYDIHQQAYAFIPGTEDFIILENLPEEKILWSNSGSAIYDLGDGILNVEFRTKMNTMGGEVIEGLNKAIDLAESSYEGLVVGSQASNFSAGANLGMIFMYAIEQEFDEIAFMVKRFQDTVMRARYSDVPVVVAPYGMTLGGSCELTLHADRAQALAETYMGLVEFGVGVIPAGGGTKELALRVSDRHMQGDVDLNTLYEYYMNMAQAKVSTSAHEAFDLGYLQRGDRITMHKKRQIADAKLLALELAEQGYQKPSPRNDIKVFGKEGLALFKVGAETMKIGRYISEHDQKIAEKLAYVITGGDLSYPHWVTEQYLLDLEREAFLSLVGERKTLERIESVLKGGKPIRN